MSESSWRGKPHPSATSGEDMKQTSHPPESRHSESLNKQLFDVVENRHKIPNALSISHSNSGDKSSSDCALSGPPGEFYAWSRIIPMWQLSSQIPTVYHLNDSGGHLSPWLIVSATRTWHLSIAVRVILHWWFSSALWSSLCKTLLSLIYVSGDLIPYEWNKRVLSITVRSIQRSVGKWPLRWVPRTHRSVIIVILG